MRFGFILRYQRVRRFDIPEDRRLHGVIVLLRNRSEFVVVAARALNRKSEYSTSDGSENIVEVIKTSLGSVLFSEVHSRSVAQETGGNSGIDVSVFNLVTGDLLFYKDVVRFVLVKSPDHIVSIQPGVRTIIIMLKAVGISVTRDVQPVAAPSLAVMWCGEPFFQPSLPTPGRGV